jgi:PAS domain S-box-containing protein
MPFLVIIALIALTVTIIVLLRIFAHQRRTISQLNLQALEQTKTIADSQRRQGLLFLSNPSPMWIFDCETLRFLEVNDAAVKNYGYSREEFLAMTVRDIRPEDEVPAFLELVKQRWDGYSKVPGVWRHRLKDGSHIFVEIVAFEFLADGRPARMVLAIDVSERCRTEIALRESEASLKALVDNAPFSNRCLTETG